MSTDVVDQLVGIQAGYALFALREQRPDAKRNAQASFDALLDPDDARHVSRLERLAVAYWAVALGRSDAAAFYRGLLAADPVLPRATDLVLQPHPVDPPHDVVLRSLELLAREVAPALRRATAVPPIPERTTA